MKKIINIFTVLVLVATTSALAADVKSKIVIADIGRTLSFSSGSDHRLIAYPQRWMISEGKDGRKIAYPLGWMTSEGKDGRKIAYPLGWMTSEGKDGREITYPLGWTTKESQDGRLLPIPDSTPAKLLMKNPTLVGKVLELQKKGDSDTVDYAIYLWVNANE